MPLPNRTQPKIRRLAKAIHKKTLPGHRASSPVEYRQVMVVGFVAATYRTQVTFPGSSVVVDLPTACPPPGVGYPGWARNIGGAWTFVDQPVPPNKSWGGPWGTKWPDTKYVAIVANQGSITSEVDVTSSSVTWTQVGNRLVKYEVSAMVSVATAGQTFNLILCDGSNTHIDLARFDAGGNGDFCTLIINHLAGSDATTQSYTRKLRASCGAGGGAIQNTTKFLEFQIKDDGPNGNPP